jgi:glycosyltransferase involved in cell wall biosynthesis
MTITAVLCIRNEEAYLANCLRHLVRNGIHYFIIDNESSDSSAEVYRRREFDTNLVGVEELPFHGEFSLIDVLRRKMAIIEALKTDWVIHLDADEILHSYQQGESLQAALSRVDTQGWNAVNFDEFVFLPVERDYVPETIGHQPILTYYFFQSGFPRRVIAWRKACGFSMVGGGHLIEGPGLRIAPETFAMRHYIFRDQEHAFSKYTNRRFAVQGVARGWHRKRMNQPVEAFLFPPATSLKRLTNKDDHIFDRSEPWTNHYWVKAGARLTAGINHPYGKQFL